MKKLIRFHLLIFSIPLSGLLYKVWNPLDNARRPTSVDKPPECQEIVKPLLKKDFKQWSELFKSSDNPEKILAETMDIDAFRAYFDWKLNVESAENPRLRDKVYKYIFVKSRKFEDLALLWAERMYWGQARFIKIPEIEKIFPEFGKLSRIALQHRLRMEIGEKVAFEAYKEMRPKDPVLLEKYYQFLNEKFGAALKVITRPRYFQFSIDQELILKLIKEGPTPELLNEVRDNLLEQGMPILRTQVYMSYFTDHLNRYVFPILGMMGSVFWTYSYYDLNRQNEEVKAEINEMKILEELYIEETKKRILETKDDEALVQCLIDAGGVPEFESFCRKRYGALP